MRTFRLKSAPQPLVFCYPALAPLGFALAEVWSLAPRARTGISIYRGQFYLAVWAPLLARPRVLKAAAAYGAYLGPSPVRYAYCAEHGREISRGFSGFFQPYG